MIGWLLILTLYNAKHEVMQVAPVATPFESYDACWLAGFHVQQLSDLNLTPQPPPAHVAWACVPTGHEEAKGHTRRRREERSAYPPPGACTADGRTCTRSLP